jgi:hypothetical protein
MKDAKGHGSNSKGGGGGTVFDTNLGRNVPSNMAGHGKQRSPVAPHDNTQSAGTHPSASPVKRDDPTAE